MIPKSIQFKIGAFIMVLYGIFKFSEGAGARKELAALEKDGVTVPGVIESAEKETSGSWRRRSTEYTVFASYITQAGARRAKFEVTSSFFEPRVSGSGQGGTGAIVNPNVEIRYLPTNFKNSIIVGGSVNKASDFWFGMIVTVAGFGGLIYLFVYNPFED